MVNATDATSANTTGSNDGRLRQRTRRRLEDDATPSTSPDPDNRTRNPAESDTSNGRLRSDSDDETPELFSPSSANRTSILETNIPRLSVALLASMTTGGTVYAFGLYGNALKKNLHLTQSQLDTISTAIFLAGCLSWIPGLVVDYFGTRFGISCGATAGAIALMMYWHVSHHGLDKDEDGNSLWFGMSMQPSGQFGVDGTDDNSSSNGGNNPEGLIVATLSALGVTVFLSCALVTGSVFKIIVNSCGPGSKGSAVGVAKGYVGLGAGAYACFFESIRQPYTSDLEFLPMAAFFFIVAAAIPSWFILPTKQQEKEREERQRIEQQQRNNVPSQDISSGKIPDVTTPTHFRVLYSSLILMASVIVGNSILTLYHGSRDGRHQPHLKHEEDDDLFPDDDDLAVFDKLQENNLSSTGDRQNYPLAVFLLVVWWAPIVSLYFLPQGTHHMTLVDALDEEHENLLGDIDAGNAALSSSAFDDNEGGELHASTTEDFLSDLNSTEKRNAGDSALSSMNDLEEDTQSQGEDDEQLQDLRQVGESGTDKNLLQMLSTPTAWLMLWTTTILVGGGTVETNNLGQMVESLNFPDMVTPAALALFSVAQSLSRAATGAMSESALNWNTRRCGIDNGVPRPVFLIIASFAGFISHGLLAVSTSEIPFVFGVFLSGIAFGMVWPLMVLIVGEVWGTAHVAANYMFFDGFTSAGGTLLLSKFVAQEVYERHIRASFVPPTDVDTSVITMEQEEALIEEEENLVMGTEFDVGGMIWDGVTCYGQDCFRMTHVVVSALSLLCILTSIAMQYTTRHEYNRSSLHRQ